MKKFASEKSSQRKKFKRAAKGRFSQYHTNRGSHVQFPLTPALSLSKGEGESSIRASRRINWWYCQDTPAARSGRLTCARERLTDAARSRLRGRNSFARGNDSLRTRIPLKLCNFHTTNISWLVVQLPAVCSAPLSTASAFSSNNVGNTSTG